ncbi:hypothetical protein BB561_001067 [Smittium simulii]|uniref:Gamma-soluble NSF attachment protein n=1 Tax=Smittium simulii TaxID=133385 RepID=A0A2T9YW84_9FUNG|nr:hypothetical protein BB561_001067 [Smittium simulii]
MSLGSLPVAENYIKQAKKAAKSGWFSSPEFEIAAQYYEKAAVAYQAANEYQLAYDTYLLAAQTYNKVSLIYFTAKSREAAGKISEKKLLNLEMAGCQYQAASDLYLATGNMPDRAAELMSLAGKMYENTNIDNAIQLHLNSITIYETENRGSEPSFLRSDQRDIADKMISAYKDFDQEMLDNAIKSQVLYDLNSQIRNLAYSLTVPGFSKNVLGVESVDYRKSVSNILDQSNVDNLQNNDESDDFGDSLL